MQQNGAFLKMFGPLLCDRWSTGMFGSVRVCFAVFSTKTTVMGMMDLPPDTPKNAKMCTVSAPERQFAENVARNGRKTTFLGKISPFSWKNANLPNRTCPVLPFLNFSVLPRKTSNLRRIFSENPKNQGKEGQGLRAWGCQHYFYELRDFSE